MQSTHQALTPLLLLLQPQQQAAVRQVPATAGWCWM
jgi:hypothetical protein